MLPALPSYAFFAWKGEDRLIGHRGLVQSIFNSFQGVIVHLADKDLEGGFPWFAGQLFEWSEGYDSEGDQVLRFRSEIVAEVQDLLQRLLDASPVDRILFSTDYQFGGDRREGGECDLQSFWDRHAHEDLRFNTLYYLTPTT